MKISLKWQWQCISKNSKDKLKLIIISLAFNIVAYLFWTINTYSDFKVKSYHLISTNLLNKISGFLKNQKLHFEFNFGEAQNTKSLAIFKGLFNLKYFIILKKDNKCLILTKK